jgi:uncharacterized protein
MPDSVGPDISEDSIIEHSPLEREVEQNGLRVKICIYREKGAPTWLLEVVDQDGGSTVWDDPFDSDQAALDEALNAIEEDELPSFAKPLQAPSSAASEWLSKLDAGPLSEIKQTLESSPQMLGFHATCGVFAAVATAPEMVRSSAWLELIKGEHVFNALDEVGRFTSGIMALYNEVLLSVAEQGAGCCPDPSDSAAVGEFCTGYLEVALSDPTWEANERAFVELLPMMALAGHTTMDKVAELLPSAKADPEGWLRQAREALSETVAGLYAYWHDQRKRAGEKLAQQASPMRRDAAKVGRNDPCPCRSGKKFKKCCAN